MYNPASYPDHGTGLFFVGLESNSRVYAYALNHSGGFTRIASFASGYTLGVMGLDWDEERDQLWVVCDDTCGGRHGVFSIETAVGPDQGKFTADTYYERPVGDAEPQQRGLHDHPARRVRRRFQAGVLVRRRGDRRQRAEGRHAQLHAAHRPDGHVHLDQAGLRGGRADLPCHRDRRRLRQPGGHLDRRRVVGGLLGHGIGQVRFNHPGTCVINADQAGNADYAPGSATPQSVTVGKAADRRRCRR